MCYGLFAPLGTLQIMVGLFNIGLGPGRTSMHPGDVTNLGAAYWLGAVIIAVGVVSCLPVCCGSRCFMCFVVFMNVVGSVFGIIACVLYAVDVNESSFQWDCENTDNCMFVAYSAQKMLTGMDITLIVMAALQVWVSVSLAVLGIMSFRYTEKEERIKDAEIQQPLLRNDLLSILRA